VKRLLIGVSGGSASGKTAIARAAAAAAAPLSALVILEDDFYRDHGAAADFDAARFNFDHPSARDHALMADQLERLRAGQAVDAPIYDFTIHRRRGDTRRLEPADVIVAEGIHLFCDARLRALFDVKVFIDTPGDVRLARRLMRDVNERGRTPQSVVGQYLRTVRPMHAEHTEAWRSEADILIANDAPAASPAETLPDVFAALARPLLAEVERFKQARTAAAPAARQPLADGNVRG